MSLFDRIYGCVIFAVVGIITLIIFIDCLRTHYYGWGTWIALFMFVISAANFNLYARGKA